MAKKIGALLVALCMLLSLSACGLSIGSHEVRFELNGGTLVSGELLQKVKSGESPELPVAEREGYELVGWSGDLDNVKENIVSVAQWAKLYTISFDPNGGELVSGELEQEIVEGGLPEEPTLERRFAAFDGWDPALSEVQGNVTYVAQWKHIALSPEDLYEYISPAVVELQVFDINGRQFALGSGFFIDEAGTLVTNYHVIEASYSATALLSDGSTVDISYIKAYDPDLDLAILQADLSGNAALAFAAQGVKTGETVFALGSSQGLTGSFSEGIVSTASREIDGVACIQTTAPISQGNSGGPLVNNFGEVVGVNSMTMDAGQNLNFAIDIKELDKLDPSLTLSLPDFYEATAPEVSGSEQTGHFYDQTSRAEVESNDTILLADVLPDGTWVAGEVTDADDIDCFYIQLDSACDVTFTAATEYQDDFDYFGALIFVLGEDDLEEVGELQLRDDPDGNFNKVFTATYHLEAGAYFAALYVDDSYPYSEPVYYVIRAAW